MTSDPVLAKFQWCLTTLSKELGMTDRQVAELLEVSPAAICRWRNGERVPMKVAQRTFTSIMIEAIRQHRDKLTQILEALE